MKKILHVIHGLNLGGAETFIYNLLGVIDHSKYRFDFVIQEQEIKHHKFEELIYATGGQIFRIPDFAKNPIAHYKGMKRVVSTGNYDVVHIHNNAYINPLPAIAASKFVNTVIIHSHSTSNGRGGIIGKVIHRINSTFFIKPQYTRLSCSLPASHWMFGRKGSLMVGNALNPTHYAYNATKAAVLRAKFGLDKAFVIGQVGRLIELKNQKFSISLLKEFINRHQDIDTRLILVGEGSMRTELEQYAAQLGVADKVIFTGNIQNMAEFYTVFDVLVMPSLFEGLAFVGIEAQAAGLKTIISDTVTPEINATGTTTFCSLDEPEQWIRALEQATGTYDRFLISNKIVGSPFDIYQMLTEMETVYE